MLKHDGYTAVRSAGSHSATDLVAIKGDSILLIQVKPDGKRGLQAARHKMAAIKCPANVQKQVWLYKRNGNGRRVAWRVVNIGEAQPLERRVRTKIGWRTQLELDLLARVKELEQARDRRRAEADDAARTLAKSRAREKRKRTINNATLKNRVDRL